MVFVDCEYIALLNIENNMQQVKKVFLIIKYDILNSGSKVIKNCSI